MDEFQKELMGLFREEVAESLDELAQLVTRLPSLAGDAAKQAISAAFRAAHNSKGAARTVGLDEFEQLAHVVEDALAPFRDSDSRPSPALCASILNGVSLLERIAVGEELADEAEAAAVAIASANSDRPSQPAKGRRAAKKRSAKESPAAELIEASEVAAAPDARTSSTATVRVDVDRLDGVMAH